MSFRLGYRGWIFLVLFWIALFHKPILKTFFVLDYEREIAVYSEKYHVSSALISAMIFVESGFDATALSHKGAVGLMQIMPETGAWIADRMLWSQFHTQDLLVPERNLQVGIWYISYLKSYFNHNDYLALASYNAGQAYVSKWIKERIWSGNVVTLEQIPFPETRNYLFKIMVYRRLYRYLYKGILN